EYATFVHQCVFSTCLESTSPACQRAVTVLLKPDGLPRPDGDASVDTALPFLDSRWPPNSSVLENVRHWHHAFTWFAPSSAPVIRFKIASQSAGRMSSRHATW